MPVWAWLVLVASVALVSYQVGRFRQRAALYGRHSGVLAESEDGENWIGFEGEPDWRESPTGQLHYPASPAFRVMFDPPDYDPRSGRFRGTGGPTA